MRAGEVAAVEELARSAIYGLSEPPGAAHVERAVRRIAHLQASDPGGAWGAQQDGRMVGLALALVREGVWGLSLLGVAPELQGRGIGRRLLEASFDYGRDARGHLILSSESPAAMRRYARLGLELRPCVAAAGIVDEARLDRAAALDGIEDAGPDGIPVADAIGRAVRGAGHGPDLEVMLEDAATHLLLVEDRAFAVVRDERVLLVAGRDEDAAARA